MEVIRECSNKTVLDSLSLLGWSWLEQGKRNTWLAAITGLQLQLDVPDQSVGARWQGLSDVWCVVCGVCMQCVVCDG